tara:strand:+ start:419 stop:1570 length:1152 start_codon:yes stop_codon:yes gene_type:complete
MFWKKKPVQQENRDFLESVDIEHAQEDVRQILAMVAHITDGLIVFNKEKVISLVNPRAEKLLRVKRSRILGKSILELSDVSNIQPLVDLLGGGIKRMSKKELKIKSNFILEVSVVPMKIKTELVGSLVILHDITKNKLIEKMKSDFVTLAAHQLRTPASGLKWTLKALLDGDQGEMTQKQKIEMKKAYVINEKIITLVNDLLDVAQIEEGKYLSNLALGDMDKIIKESIQLFEKDFKEKNVKLKIVEQKTKLPKVMMDKEKMEIAVKNLIDNAVSYTTNGDIEISVQLKGKGNEKRIEFKVSDTGIGIPLNQQGKVFTKFFRGTNSMKIDTEGNGLGLYLTKNIIEAHEGTIGFKSEENVGSIFYFTIPIKEKFNQFLTPDFY